MFHSPTSLQRHVIIHLATAADFHQQSNSACNKIVAITILIDDGVVIMQHSLIGMPELQILKGFWSQIHSYDVIIGAPPTGAAMTLIRQRTFVHGVRPANEEDLQRLMSHEVVDIETGYSSSHIQVERGIELPSVDIGRQLKLDGLMQVHSLYQEFMTHLGQPLPLRYGPGRMQDSDNDDGEHIVHSRD